ncbi:MAG: ATP synthase F1 subunit delta [Bacteroidales bacterium]
MNSGRVAIRYAKGLLKFGNQKGISDQLYVDAITLIQVIKNSESLVNLLGDPTISYNQKIEILRKSLSDVHPDFIEYLSMIVQKGRFEYIHNSLLLFCDIYRIENNILHVIIESANILPEQELKEIESFIVQKYNKSVELVSIIKPELIAGYVLIVDGKILDYSVSGQLVQCRKSLGLSFSN